MEVWLSGSCCSAQFSTPGVVEPPNHSLCCAPYCTQCSTLSPAGNIVFSNLTVARDAYETLGTETILFDAETAEQFTQEELGLLQWRKCSKTHPRAENGLFLRYAVNKDQKVRGAASQSAYYTKYGRQKDKEKEEEVRNAGSDLR